jgi:hypothetical protein
MALNKTKPAPAVNPAFEDDSTSTTTIEPTQADVKTAAEAANTAIAVAKAGHNLPALGGNYGNIYEQLRNAMPPMEFGTLPRLTGAQGKISAKESGKKVDLGESIDLTLLSYNDEYQVSPGEDSDDATKLVRYSLDGQIIDGTGEKVSEYLEKLRTVDGYTDAKVKRYVQLVGILERSDKKSDYVGNMVQVSLSPQAAKAWDAFMAQGSVRYARNKWDGAGADLITVRAESRSNGKNDFTLLTVALTPQN